MLDSDMQLCSKKILVTGANGQIGRHLVKRLKDKTTLLATNKQMLDITNRQAVFATVHSFQPDVIINAAAYTNVDKAESEPERAYAVNADGAQYLAQAAQSIGAALLHISTDYVFDGAKNTPYIETDIPNPINVYGKSKLAGERAVANACERSVIVRTSWVFSEYGNNFVKTMLELAKTRDTIEVVSDQIGGPTYAGDIANILVTMAGIIAASVDFEYGIYHYCGLPYVSRYDFAKTIFEQAKKQDVAHQIPQLKPVLSQNHSAVARRPVSAALGRQKVAQTLRIQSGDSGAALNELFLIKYLYDKKIDRED